MGATELLAEFVVGADPAVDEAAARSLLDARCAIIAGRATALGEAIAATAQELGSDPSPSARAWAMAATAAASAMEDAVAYGAAGAPVWPALLALAEHAGIADEMRLLEAGSIGIRTALALWRAGSYQEAERGFDGGGVFGAIAAAAGGARLLELDRRTVVAVLSLAATQSGGLVANAGTGAGYFHAGNAARDGVVAVTLGASGFSGAPDIFEGRQGFGEAFFGLANSRLGRLERELAGSRPLAAELRSKHVPGHIDHQRAVRGLQSVLADMPGARVTSVRVDGVPPTSLGNRVYTPASPEQAPFSLRYALACVLERGTVGLLDYRPARMSAVAGLDRIRVSSAPRWDRRIEAEDADARRMVVEFDDRPIVEVELGDLPATASTVEVLEKWRRTSAELAPSAEATELDSVLHAN